MTREPDTLPTGDTPGSDTRAEAAAGVDRWLVYAVAVGVVTILSFVLYLLLVGLLNPAAPRTFEERQLSLLKTVVDEKPNVPEAWADYARVLIDTGQYSLAQRVIQQARSNVGAAPLIDIEEARLLDARGQSQEAIALLDTAVEETLEFRRREMESLEERGVQFDPYQIAPGPIIAASILKAEILERANDWQGAIEAYTLALEQRPQMSDVLMARGDAYRSLGADADAINDYRAAFGFGLEAARERLEQMGEETER